MNKPREYRGHWEARGDSRVWVMPMPRISTTVLHCVFYLFKDAASADGNELAGGTGFFIEVPDELPMIPNPDGIPRTRIVRHLYAVTNEHNIRSGYPVIRLNEGNMLLAGEHKSIPLSVDDWEPHPDGDDLAVALVSLKREYTVLRLSERYLIAPEDCISPDLQGEKGKIGCGDEVFMVGRLIDHQGRQKNTPLIRFGNISMLPTEPVEQWERGFHQDSFMVEMRSVPGFSGSPVFTYNVTPEMGNSPEPKPEGYPSRRNIVEYLAILGIEWGAIYIPALHQVGTRVAYTDHPTGISGVVPAWKLKELLHSPKVAEARRAASLEYWEKKAKSSVRLD